MSSITRLATQVCATIALVLPVAACGSVSGSASTAQTHKSVTIAYGALTEAQQLHKTIGDGVKAAVEAQGDKFMLFDNKGDAAAAVANARLMVQQKPDLIVETVPEPAAATVGKLISDSKIPCIAVNLAIPGCSLFNLSNARFGDEAGNTAADEAKRRGWAPDSLTVGLISISIGGEEVHQNVSHFYSAFASHFPTMKQVDPSEITLSTTSIGNLNGVQVDSQGTLDTAYKAMQQILQIVPKDRHLVVQTQNDDSARGALRAAQQAGRDDVIIGSAGADPDAVTALRTNPAWIAEGDPNVSAWGKYIQAMSKAVLDGVTPPELTVVPQYTLTKSNVDQYYTGTASKGAAPVPSEDSYLNKYLNASNK